MTRRQAIQVILSYLENKDDLEQAGRTLVERANEAGGKDNISVILVRL